MKRNICVVIFIALRYFFVKQFLVLIKKYAANIALPNFIGGAIMNNSLDQINQALEFISSDERGTWLNVGMALHNEGIPFSVWENWSKKSSKYDFQACENTWKSFKRGGGITIATLFDLAKKAGWKPTSKEISPKEKASSIWQESLPVDNHPYLTKKQIKPYIARQYKGSLVIPLFDIDGIIQSLQFINQNGEKRFLKDGKKAGFFCMLEGQDSELIICEGFATASSIREATGATVIVAFDSGNLKPVAEKIRKKYSEKTIIIAGDDDKTNSDNVGRKKATQACLACNGKIAFPIFSQGTGKDFNDLASTENLEAVLKSIRATQELTKTYTEPIYESDKYEEDMTLKLPDSIWQNCGILTDGIDACFSAGIPILQYSFPSVCCVIARAIAGNVFLKQAELQKIHPTFFNIKVGRTSTGKTSVDNFLCSLLEPIPDFISYSEFSSGPGLLRGIMRKPQCLLFIDEASYIFKRPSKNDSISNGKIHALLELHKGGNKIEKTFAKKENDIKILNPMLILSGNATPCIFDDLTIEDENSGLLQRFDFFCYDGKSLYRKNDSNNENAYKFFDDITKLINQKQELTIDSEAKNRIDNFSNEIIDQSNETTNDGIQGIISRQYETAIKYAIIHYVSKHQLASKTLTLENIDWGIRIASLLCEWKHKILFNKISSGDFERMCKAFLAALQQLTKNGRKRSSFAALCNRKQALKNLRPRELDDIVKSLQSQNAIIVHDDGSYSLA